MAKIHTIDRMSGDFNRAKGIWIDEYVYVADFGNNRIQKFDEYGNFITEWGSKGSGRGLMNFPSGVAVNSQGYVWVIERENNRYQIFKPSSGSDSEKSR